MQSKQTRWLFLLFIAYTWFQKFGTSVLPSYFLASGLSLSRQMLGIFFGFAGEAFLLLNLQKFSAKMAMFLGIIATFVNLLLIMTIKSDLQFYLASAIGGCSTYLFAVVYYIAHFDNTKKENRGVSSALLFVIPTLIGFAAPLVAGFVLQIDRTLLWIMSGLSFLVSIYLVKFQADFKIEFTLKHAIMELKATRVLLFIEGIWETLMFGVIPIYTLFFIKTPLGYGTFLAYVSLVSVIANLTLGKITDKLKKRFIFLYPVTIILGLTTIFFVFATKNINIWIVAVSVIQFFVPLFWTLATALVVDTHSDLRVALPGREFVLGCGRMLGLMVAFISFSYEKSPYFLFIFLGLAMLCYPVAMYWNSKIFKTSTYF